MRAVGGRRVVVGIVGALIGISACRPGTEPDSPIGVATVRDALVAPMGQVRVRVTRSQDGTWYASACSVRIQRRYAEGWADAPAQPTNCNPTWLAFGPGQPADFVVEMPFNSSDGAHRLVLFVLPYDMGAGPIVTIAPLDLDEVRLVSNSFEGIAFR